ncbi:MAG: MFS transporter [Armatimonadota bacterium]|nr:MFS transporter [Armatimonadota bacterium]
MVSGDKGEIRRQIALFMFAGACLGAASGVFETTFNNFLNDTFHLSASARGQLEFPRELPGFLTAALSGALFFLLEARMAALAALGIAAGMFGLATMGTHYGAMLAFMVLWSAGAHLLMPLQGSIGLSLSEKGKEATLLGRLGSVSTAATIVGCGFVWLATRRFALDYSLIFLGGGSAALIAVLLFAHMRVRGTQPDRRPFLVRREYSLYYLLCILFGARKQVFITFGPWVLIQVFHQPASTFASLWIFSAIIGVFLKPALGRWIDRYGERRVLMADAFLLIFVCLGYGFAERLGLGKYTLSMVYGCYMLDQILFGTGMARTTFLDKIARSRDDVAPTLSLGVTLDHAVSMSVPTLGGFIWAAAGYPYVFLAAAVIALFNLTAASRIRTPTSHEAARAAAAASSR